MLWTDLLGAANLAPSGTTGMVWHMELVVWQSATRHVTSGLSV